MSLRPRLGAGPRSLRVKLIGIGLVLALLPLVLLALALLYEQWLVGRLRHRLQAAAEQSAGAAEAELPALGRKLRVEIARLDGQGRVVARSRTMEAALERGPVDRIGERLVGSGPAESLEVADAEGGPWGERDEVKAALAGTVTPAERHSSSTQTIVVALAQPRPGGGAVYLLTATHRGVQRLVFLRRQIYLLVLYEVLLALPLVLLFAFRIVRPIERLADAARRYPAVPLADEKLLGRNDEIATLARILATMAADLERRRQQAADLGADMAHEFKGPLASIAASAELLSTSKALTPERLALVSGTIEKSVERLRRSLDELLALLRLEQAVPAEAREPVGYREFLGSVLDDYRGDPRWAGWRFTLAGEVDGPVSLNRARWAELLRNLIDNALVQPAEQKEIVVSVRRRDGMLATSVRDHGPGVSAENREKIFRRFFTARPAGAAPGTGLGLSVVETIARAHGAHVEVGAPEGGGAEFTVVLPL
jgi:two-component system, OmpR family, sensor histidine kinase ChvG